MQAISTNTSCINVGSGHSSIMNDENIASALDE